MPETSPTPAAETPTGAADATSHSAESAAPLSLEEQRELVRLLNVARGCHDYGGGYRDTVSQETFHHGIQTVINALESAAKNEPNNFQVDALEAIGRTASIEQARQHLRDALARSGPEGDHQPMQSVRAALGLLEGREL